jgi:peptidoglycan/LPS O-acetylase OafA/YrhL
MQNLSHQKYRPDIDGLRAIAIIAVVAFHAFPYSDKLKGGFIGVDVFFVISGYLISNIIFDEINNENFTFREFYARRVRRIFPALITVLVSCLIFGYFGLLAHEFRALNKYIASSAAFVLNFSLWNESGYFDISSELKPLLHLWSLSIEEQFYAIWPILVYLAVRNKLKINAFATACLLLSFLCGVYFLNLDNVAAFYLPFARFWELIAGCIIAWNVKNEFILLHGKLKSIRDQSLNVTSIAGLILLILGFCLIDSNRAFPGFWAIFPVLGTALLIASGPDALVNKFALSNKIFVWIGKISYPLYLWHWPILSFIRISNGEISSKNRNLALLVTIFLAWFTYRFIELPIRNKAKEGSKVLVLSSFMAGLFIVGLIGFFENGFPGRDSLKGLDNPIVMNLGDDLPQSHKDCLRKVDMVDHDIRFCRISSEKVPSIAIIGDSHGAALYQALADVLGTRGQGLLMIGGRLFTTVATYTVGSEKEFINFQGGAKATKYVASNDEIRKVIVVSRGPSYINDDVWKFYLLSNPEIKDRLYIYERGMRDVLDLLLKNNKEVIWVLDNPELNYDIRMCANDRPLHLGKTSKQDCSMKRDEFEVRHKDYRELISNVLKDYPSVKVFDSAQYLCDQIICYGKKNSVVYYGDSDHLSYDGSKLLSVELVKLLSE